MSGSCWISLVDIFFWTSPTHIQITQRYASDILRIHGYYVWISVWILYGYVWIPVGYLQWVSFWISPKHIQITQRYPSDILSYPIISNDIRWEQTPR
jgi:hypothetical protein